MAYSVSIPQIQLIGRFVQYYADPTSFLDALFNPRTAIVNLDKKEQPHASGEDFPLPDGGEIYPNKEVPEEEKYLPDEQEVPVEEPPKEIEEDPYFPRKGDGMPPEKEEEFPKTDPV